MWPWWSEAALVFGLGGIFIVPALVGLHVEMRKERKQMETSRVSLGAMREVRRRDGWITTSDRSAAIRAVGVPGGVRVESTDAQVSLSREQAQMLCSQIRNETRKQK